MGDGRPDPRSATAVLELIAPLGLSHPSIPHLLALKPLARPSTSPHSLLTKFCGRINSAVLGRDGEASVRSACGLARRIVLDDTEGWVLSEYGKTWVNTCLTDLSTQTTSLPVARLELLGTLILQSPQYPSFEREAIHPIMGKVSVTLTKLLGTSLSAEHTDLNALMSLLKTLYEVINHSPSPFRPSTPSLRTLLQSIIVPPQPSDGESSIPKDLPMEIKEMAADVLASLHLTNGKAQIPSSWSSEAKSALGGIGMALNGIVGEGFVEEPYRVMPPQPPAGYSLPTDANERLPLALMHLEGWVEALLALLRFPTSRPVPVPVAQVVAAGLRCLNLTLDTPTLPYISPQHRASLVASLPRIWTAGLQLLASIANSVGDHLFPHLSLILDHTVWLSETVPKSMHETHLQLLQFHSLFLELYPPAVVPVEYPTRLLRLSLGYLSPLLEPKASSSEIPTTNGMSKRGKKRARGAEDGLVGGLEGRERASLSEAEVEIIVASLGLVPSLHPTPLLAPALLTLSIRLHMSLYLSLPSFSHLLRPPSQAARIQAALAGVLEKAALMNEGEGGTSRGWKPVILSILAPGRERSAGDGFSLLLHPALPPLHRPLPPLSQLHFFSTETEEEKKIRMELGLGKADDEEVADESNAVLEMEVDDPKTTRSGQVETVPVSRADTEEPGRPRTVMASAPQPSDLRIPVEDQVKHTATFVQPTMPEPPIRVDMNPKAPEHRLDSEDPLAPDAATAPLQAASNDLYPEPVGPHRAGLAKDEVASFAAPAPAATPPQAVASSSAMPVVSETNADEDDEPIPEMDSDMDLSDDEEGDDE